MILSASGWRKVFGRDDEDTTPSLKNVDAVLAGYMGLAFSRALRGKYGSAAFTVAVATDSRPTGPHLAEAIIRILLSQDIDVRYSGITAIPELLAAVAGDSGVDGFAYVSASHNPIGHNGMKFGYSDGSVAGGSDASHLIDQFGSLCESIDPQQVTALLNGVDQKKLIAVYEDIEKNKKYCFSQYHTFARGIAAGDTGTQGADELFARLQLAATEYPLGVVAELNGSARTVSIDQAILREAGARVTVLNGNPGEIAHRIVPEGSSLDLCRNELEKLHARDNSYLLGYVPDNDGDRGNIVYINRQTGAGHILHAQEVFALACVSELAYLVYAEPNPRAPADLEDVVVAVNGPTSMRIERIAAAFGAEVRRSEVGEANVVNLARELRTQGKTVRILGEGSNGGNITHPSTCRDPINTLLAVFKLLLLRSRDDRPGLFEIWCNASGNSHAYKQDFTLVDLVGSLPQFTTTSAYEDRAIMTISSGDHGALKERYEALFSAAWPELKAEISKTIPVTQWRGVNYEGITARQGVGNRDPKGAQKGGLKILLSGKDGDDIAFIWMRGSGTEPVFRIMADVEGNHPEIEELLLSRHRELIEKADKAI